MMRKSWLAPLLLTLATLAVYVPAVGHDFVYLDDDLTLIRNPRLNPPTWKGIGYYWGHGDPGLWDPLTYTVWGLVAMGTWVPGSAASPQHLDARVFHAVSIGVHACAVLGCFALLRVILRVDETRDRRGRRPGRVECAAVAGALLYALHPLQVEAVAWASTLKDLLYCAFSMAAMVLYLKAARAAEGGGGRAESTAPVPAISPLRCRSYWIGTLFLGLALLSKPSAVITPFLAALLDVMLLGRPLRRVMASIAPWLALATPIVVITQVLQPSTIVAAPPTWQRPLVATRVMGFYAAKVAVPLDLVPDYGLRSGDLLQGSWPWLAALVVAATLALAVRLRGGRFRVPAAAVLFFLVALLPTAGLVPFAFQQFSTVADHYAQLAMFGVALAIGWAAANCPIRWVGGIIVPILCVCAVLNLRQQRWWRDTEALYAHQLAVNPRSYLAHANYGAYLHAKGDWPQAEREYRRAIELYPQVMFSRANLVKLLATEGRIADAMAEIDEAQRINPTLPPQDRFDLSDAYMTVIDEAQRINQTLPPERRADLSQTYFEAAVAEMRAHRPAQAVPFLQRQLRLVPDHAGARALLEEANRQMGK
jgi:tetratricopeptide (TPR) repeat protein